VRSIKIYLIIILAGLGWALGSDLLISSLEYGMSAFYLESIRILNNCLLVGLTTFGLYRYIRWQQGQLKESVDQYRNLFESNPNPMWVFHIETRAFVAVNDAAIAKYGYSRDEFLRMSILDIRPAEDRGLLKEALKGNSEQTRDVGRWRHIKRNGEIFPVSIVSHNVNFNQQLCKMVMVTDMTDVVQLQGAVKQEQELRDALAENYEKIKKAEMEGRIMAQIMDKINNLVVIVGEDHLIFWVNQAFSHFTGYTLEDAIGKSPSAILFGPETDPQTIERLGEAVIQQSAFSDEMINYKKNRQPYWSQINISPIFDEDGKLQFFVSVENVITERKDREQKIMAQHTALQEIAWSNSHELRRPVCSIQGLVTVLQAAKSEAERDECLTMLQRSSDELDQILQNTNQRINELTIDQPVY
jgi:PAS domain S-box-containing protein